MNQGGKAGDSWPVKGEGSTRIEAGCFYDQKQLCCVWM